MGIHKAGYPIMSGAAVPWYASEAYKADGTSPVLLIDFIQQRYAVNATPVAFSDLFTFTRTGNAYYFNAAGLLTAAAGNVPRFDYDPSTLAPRGLLIENAGTNNLLYSDDLTNAAWAKTNCTAAKNAIGPDGVTNSASTLTATGADGTALQPRTLASAARSFSVYLKRKTGGGTVSLTRDGGSTYTDITSQLSSLEWKRFKIENSSVLNPSCGIKITTSGDEVLVFGMQDEATTFSTSYIPTTSATVTRNIEQCQNGTGNVVPCLSWYNTAAGTTYFNDISSPNPDGDNMFSFNAASNFSDLANSGGFSFYRVYNGGFIINPARAHVPNIEVSRAFAFATNNFGYYHLGTQVFSGGTGSAAADINAFRIQPNHSSVIKGILHYNFRVSNAEMARITTP